jgi:hypothetical protein
MGRLIHSNTNAYDNAAAFCVLFFSAVRAAFFLQYHVILNPIVLKPVLTPEIA